MRTLLSAAAIARRVGERHAHRAEGPARTDRMTLVARHCAGESCFHVHHDDEKRGAA